MITERGAYIGATHLEGGQRFRLHVQDAKGRWAQAELTRAELIKIYEEIWRELLRNPAQEEDKTE